MKGFYIAAVPLMATLVGAPAGTHATAAHRARRVQTGQHAASTPQPPIIPQQFAPPQEAYASFPQPAAVATAKLPSACGLRLTQIAVFRPLPVLVGPGECGADDAVLLQTVILPDQTKVAVTPAATLRCTMAEEIAKWVREDVTPAALEFGAPVRELDNLDSYECRGFNRVSGATLSEHGRANALDVRDFKLASGKEIGLTDINVPKTWRERIKASACARFSTVLGPGSDGSHEEHIHLDLAERRNNYKICQWDVREPPVAQAQLAPEQSEARKLAVLPPELVPLPRPRPPVAAPTAVRHGSLKSRRHIF
ncbi:MAG TPA: extensin family protein [Xanthobacteraceae bacterium]